MDLETIRAAEAEQQADQAKLDRIADNIADLSPVAASRVSQRIDDRMRTRTGYIGQIVAELRRLRADLAAGATIRQSWIDAERDNIDELRLLRRLDEITREESEQRIESARANVRDARDTLRDINTKLAEIDQALAGYPEESER